MEYPRQITVIEAVTILISTIIGVGVLPLPRFAVLAADTGAPLATLLGIILAFLGAMLITILGIRFSDKSFVLYSEQILGRWLASIGSASVVVFFMILTALAAREFGEVVITSVLRKTPLEITVIVMLLLAAIPTRNNITVFAYIHHFYIPMIVAPVLVIVGLSLKNATILNLQPVLGSETNELFMGALTIAALFQGSFIISLVIPNMRRPQEGVKATLWGMAIASSIYFVIVIATVAVFGSEEVKLLIWPTLELARTTSLPAALLERLDAIFLIVWVTAVFTTLFSSYYLTIHMISDLTRLHDHKMLSFFILPFIFVTAMLPENVVQMYKVIEWIGRAGLLVTIVYPVILFVVAIIRKKKGSN